MKLLRVDTIEEARDKAAAAMERKHPRVITRGILEAGGYTLALPVCAREPVPAFRKSVVDGYALRASDTGGATESMPVFLKIVGEILMGKAAGMKVHAGECVYVPTGGMIPDGADAVVMEEYCELFTETEAAVYKAAASGEHVVLAGEDMKPGEEVLAGGTKIRPQEIGALAALGILEAPVYQPWSISVISTGDELAEPGSKLTPGQVRDINTYGLCAQARRLGFTVRHTAVLGDDRELLRRTMAEFMADSDIVAVSGGSSQGKKDETDAVISQLASEGVFTHGLALKPGKPTTLGFDVPTGTLLAGLPGHPAAAMMVFEILFGWLWRSATGEKPPFPVTARMSVNLPAAPGRRTCQMVRLETGAQGEVVAVPVFGRSGLITVLTRADGYVLTEEHAEGLKEGETVSVYPF